jgi:phage tail tape-measure protein
MIDAELCQAVGTVLATCDGRPATTRAIAAFVRPYVRTAASVADVQATLLHLEKHGDVDREADRDDKTLLSWFLTDAGKRRFPA